ncbi:AMP-binding protein [Rhodovulum sulfidophilum]|uniref:AMP-binding protein n=1 Tax=Rhodovulum sulfidophilum TaxID=35806 RepID=UPI00192445AF|nr:AMP-binding protein [Rhodovulum sulfidophilum]MBL3575436.1 AMP-binding protein [Rhodovulum sulfidophilum]MCE8432215.1 AMP-binding protein [Rhodovulum sulfidophilum]MCF4118224.1 AMP-binding protein [Rhodovulum sulfidophilum]
MDDFTPWPEDLAHRYRERGYWRGVPLSDGVRAQAAARPGACAILCGNRSFSYGALDRMSSVMAGRLIAAGLQPGDHAVVQLPNRAEFYITFLALLKAGIRPVNALYSHCAHEMRAYVEQLEPALLVGSRAHPLFTEDGFLDALRRDGLAPRLGLWLDGSEPGQDLAQWMDPEAGLPEAPLPEAHNYLLSSPGALEVFAPGSGLPDPGTVRPQGKRMDREKGEGGRVMRAAKSPAKRRETAAHRPGRAWLPARRMSERREGSTGKISFSVRYKAATCDRVAQT